MNKDKPSSKSQQLETQTQKTTHRGEVKQRQKRIERELQQLQANQQLEQQENNDFNNINIDIFDIQGTVGQLTGLYASSGAQRQGLNAGLRLKETGSISASNREKTDRQINDSHEDNAEEEEDEQTDQAAQIKNKDYRVNIISQLQIQENLGTQPYNSQGLNAFSQMDKDNPGLALVGVQVKLKKGRGSKKSKIEGLSASNESSQGSNAQAQTKTAFAGPKPKVTPKGGTKKTKWDIPEANNSNDEDDWEQNPCSNRDTPTKGAQR
ncbi:MAG: hypothetical protein EZS28_040216 [Streblomastix strix]|uniref:Uncharacterized protein n=1 Tax=Streblomastix strix TaxID=222440 RepID=A0A5J4U1M3_9EUKA|nr:MAG: hypothetical protein EZS28_040216 [Streblomastix strix]